MKKNCEINKKATKAAVETQEERDEQVQNKLDSKFEPVPEIKIQDTLSCHASKRPVIQFVLPQPVVGITAAKLLVYLAYFRNMCNNHNIECILLSIH